MALAGIGIGFGFRPDYQGIKSQFAQLGQDLQAGKLSQAQQDYATLSQKLAPPQLDTATISLLAQQLSAAANGGSSTANAGTNTAAASTPAQSSGSASTASNASGNGSQALSQVGQALQGGNLSQAQQAYQTLQQALGQGGCLLYTSDAADE